MYSIVVISAGISRPSSTTRVAHRLSSAVSNAMNARGAQTSITTIELRDLAVDLAHALVSKEFSPALTAAYRELEAAAALIAVSPTFSASYSSLFKMFFDVMDKDLLTDKPVLLGATAGTQRHSLMLEHAMRPLFSFLRARIVPTAVFVTTQDCAEEEAREIETRIGRGARQLAREIISEPDNL